MEVAMSSKWAKIIAAGPGEEEEKEMLKFLGGLCTSALAEDRVVSQLQSLLTLLENKQGPGYTVHTVTRNGHDVLLHREVPGLERHDTCRVVFHRFWHSAEKACPWTEEDSAAFLIETTNHLKHFNDAPSLSVVVVPARVVVTTQARNAGFSNAVKHRVLPLSIREVEELDLSELAQQRAPRVVEATVAAKTIGCDLESLRSLSLILTDDEALLWDLDARCGSIVYCPLQEQFRQVAPVPVPPV